ncbi:MAG: efflux transporter outer membrane subunit, partial [Rhodocyclaceae bacterium]|nr:efflux transporter outer membrane subunit [Rhodocyclaceae bacterium]
MNARRPGRGHAAALIAATLLAGCMFGPDYKRPDPGLPAGYESGTAASASPAVERGWWKLFEDDTLNTLIDQALAGNANIALAAARIDQADAFAREVDSAWLPETNVNLGATRAHASAAIPGRSATAPILSNTLTGTLSTSFELDFWGKLRRAGESARAQALASRAARDIVELTLVSQVTSAYLTLRSLDAQIAVSRETGSAREEALRIVRSRADRGLSSDLDLQQALGAAAAIRAQTADLERQRAAAEHQLALLTGSLDLQVAAADLRTLPAPPLPPAGLPSALLDARPDLRQAEFQLHSANAQIGVAKGALFPTIMLSAAYGSQSPALASLFSSTSSIWNLGLALTYPIFDSGKRQARLDQATAQQKQALATYIQAVRTAFTEVRDALNAVQQYAQSAKELETQMGAAQR